MTGLKPDTLIGKPAEIIVESMTRLFDPNELGGKSILMLKIFNKWFVLIVPVCEFSTLITVTG